MLGMCDVDGIDDALLVEGISLKGFKQTLYARTHVEPFAHHPCLVVSVCPTFPNPVYRLLLLAVGTNRVVVVESGEPPFRHEPPYAPRRYHHVKQVGESIF